MRSSLSRSLAVAAALTLLGAHDAVAQRGWDAQMHAMVLVRDSTFVGGGAGGGLRMGRGFRVGLTAGAGWVAPGAAGGRAEVVAAYHLSPPGRRTVGVYAGAGAAAELVRGDLRGLVVAVLGLEARPWAGGGFFAEAGVGGGARVVVGYRLIRLAARPVR